MRPSNLIPAAKPATPEFDIFDCAYIASGATAGKTADLFNSFASMSVNSPSESLTFGAPSTILLNATIGAPGEADLYSIALTGGRTYMFSVYGSGTTPLQDSYFYLLDGSLAEVDHDDDGGSGTNSLYTFTPTTSGTYNFAVGAYPGSGLTGQYTLDIIQKPLVDVVSDSFASAPAINPNGVTYGFIDSGATGPYGPGTGEVDTYKVTVAPGSVVTIELAGGADYESFYLSLPPGELDTFLVIYDQDLNLVTYNDDISFSSGDISSRVSFFSEEGGTYYIDAFSYAPWTGGFTITTSTVNLADLDPLDSIDWKNSDTIDVGPGGVVKVYFALPGENFGELADNGVDPAPSFGWNAFEKQQVLLALNSEYGKILGFTYEETTNQAEAEFRIFTTDSDQFGAFFYPQDPVFGSSQGVGAFNVNSGGWDKPGVSEQDIPGNQVSLLQGGFSFAVILHEFGHAHGLAHPHDNGGGSDIMPGVTGPFDSYGVFDLNQGVYTVMSYNDSWPTGPNGGTPFSVANIDAGWSGTLGAFDIAQLQEKYGINNPHNTGNNVYQLGDVNGVPGVYYETIWDTGGTDEIRYSGNRNARIDLLAATIDYTPTGGGVVSYVSGIFGGYTIARNVVIENATGGAGDDVLIGNSAANVIKGNGGDDFLMGREGGDSLQGGAGFDTASYVDADAGVTASLASNSGSAGDAAGDTFNSIEELEGSQFADTLTGGNNADTLTGLGGDDTLNGGNGTDTIEGGEGNDTVSGANHDDTLNGGGGDDSLNGGNHNDTLNGGAGNDTLWGGNHNDVLNGGAGDDVLNGGAHNDWFVFTETGGADIVNDLQRGNDKIDLSAIDAVSGGTDNAFTWIGAGAFTGVAGQLRSYNSAGNFFLAGDVNGDMVADFTIQTNLLIIQSDVVL